MSRSEIKTAKRKELTEYQLGEIAGLIKGGAHTLREISTTLDIPYSTVKEANNRYKENGSTKPVGVRTGRTCKMNERDLRFLKRSIEAEPLKPYSYHLSKIREAGIDVSKRTMIRYLRKMGY